VLGQANLTHNPRQPHLFSQLSVRAHLSTMDRLESLGNTLSNLTLYDIKSMYTQVYPIIFQTPYSVLYSLWYLPCRQRTSSSTSARWRPRYGRRQMMTLGVLGTHSARTMVGRMLTRFMIIKGRELDADAGHRPGVCVLLSLSL
jgi:hypothetical protein